MFADKNPQMNLFGHLKKFVDITYQKKDVLKNIADIRM